MEVLHKFVDKINMAKAQELRNITTNLDNYYNSIVTKNFILNNDLALSNAKSYNNIRLLDMIIDKSFILAQNNQFDVIKNAVSSVNIEHSIGGNNPDTIIKKNNQQILDLEKEISNFTLMHKKHAAEVKEADLEAAARKQLAVVKEQNDKLTKGLAASQKKVYELLTLLKSAR